MLNEEEQAKEGKIAELLQQKPQRQAGLRLKSFLLLLGVIVILGAGLVIAWRVQHAMSGMVNYLVQHHQDQRGAVLPALTGDRQADWQAFERTYTTMTAHLSLNQQELVAAAIAGMVDGLHDDHAHYMPAQTDDTNGAESPHLARRQGWAFTSLSIIPISSRKARLRSIFAVLIPVVRRSRLDCDPAIPSSQSTAFFLLSINSQYRR
ncbi:hypothetical protein KSB_83200 [Ktedonobacter robiniae]|uniref:Uncharacterized protein n=1 Tax=Ktedonobacter robiniae TaxID=2778365 RepID=A0ABQ3V5W2_9CHLR|nr:hypothetical protein KSB_83200 [Ktedonobacter robiniae]